MIIPMKRNRLIFFLSLLGIAMAIYVLQSFLTNKGIVCATGGCEAVRKHPASWPLGIPVPAVGLVGYSFLTILSFLQTMRLGTRLMRIIHRAMLGIATFGVLFVSWFTLTEILVIKDLCMWCGISAVNMVVIFMLLFTDKSNMNNFRMSRGKE